MRPANANQKLFAKPTRSSESIVPPHPIKSIGFRPILSGGTSSVLGCKPLSKYAARYYRLKIRHGAIEAFSARIGIIETPKCWWCGTRADSCTSLYGMPKMEKRAKENIQRTGYIRHWLANTVQKEMAWQISGC